MGPQHREAAVRYALNGAKRNAAAKSRSFNPTMEWLLESPRFQRVVGSQFSHTGSSTSAPSARTRGRGDGGPSLGGHLSPGGRLPGALPALVV